MVSAASERPDTQEKTEKVENKPAEEPTAEAPAEDNTTPVTETEAPATDAEQA